MHADIESIRCIRASGEAFNTGWRRPAWDVAGGSHLHFILLRGARLLLVRSLSPPTTTLSLQTLAKQAFFGDKQQPSRNAHTASNSASAEAPSFDIRLDCRSSFVTTVLTVRASARSPCHANHALPVVHVPRASIQHTCIHGSRSWAVNKMNNDVARVRAWCLCARADRQ